MSLDGLLRVTTCRESTALVFAWRQMKSLRKEFAIYLLLAGLFAGLSLLPAQLLHLFAVRVTELENGGTRLIPCPRSPSQGPLSPWASLSLRSEKSSPRSG